eukprot:scaffold12868_cov96-Cylindrotheca_fusiformis.AAC.1
MSTQWKDWALPAWRITFAIVAILDISLCWTLLLDGWYSDESGNNNTKQSEIPEKKKLDFLKIRKNQVAEDICLPHSMWRWVGVVFCCLCLIESFIRAREARQIAFETAALDNFEKKLAKLYSTTRWGVFRQQPSITDYEESHEDLIRARNHIRVWTPVMSVMVTWFILIPWFTFGSMECGNDSAFATIWMTRSLSQMTLFMEQAKSELSNFLWNLLLPWDTVLQPKRLLKRIREIARWLRYIRFAGPLLRLVLKLQDQLWVFTKTWRQSLQAKTEKAKRLARRSMMFEDLQKLESLAKINTRVSSIPSQLQVQASGIRQTLLEKQNEARKLKRRLDELRREIGARGAFAIPTSELYDQIVDLRQELTTTVITAIMSSNLVSPHTRFSVGWRVIVTFALISELFRLYASWRLTGTFEVSFTDMISALLVECDQKMMDQFRSMTRKSKPIRRFVGRILHLPNVELAECMPTSPSSRLFLSMGKLFESGIDVVCFLDIFVWFFTGELDANGVIVPKPFFSRCILPGTLIQVLDHPTVPDVLPHLIQCFLDACRAVGYARVIRWAFAIYPAFEMLVVDPIKLFLFRPMDDDEYLKYTESLIFIPPVFSQTNMRRKSVDITSFKSGMLGSFPSYTSNLDESSSIGNLDDSYSVGYSLHY